MQYKPARDRKTHRFSLQVTEQQHDEAESKATDMGYRSVPAVVRKLLKLWMKGEIVLPKDDPFGEE